MDFWTNPLVLIVLAAVAAVGLMIVGRRRPALTIAMEAERERAVNEASPRCVCGEIATDPAPVLKLGRGAWDWLRNLYGAPPRYKREVDHMRPPIFCRHHVHVADAELNKFIFGIRNDYSKLNAEIAARAAGFEQEHLQRLVAESLTEKQKRATRSVSAAPIRMVRTGTEDEG
jgi:hypothetical protein